MAEWIYLDCYFYQDAELTYKTSRSFPTETLCATSFEQAYKIAPSLGKSFDRIVVSRETKGQNPIPIYWDIS